MTETAAASVEAQDTPQGLRVERVWTTPGVHPYDEVTWQRRDVVQTNWRTGETIFEQHGVEFPDFWSVNASTIVTTKYFRGAVGAPDREWSLKQLIDRVVLTYTRAGREHGYFASDDDAMVFEHELTWMLLHQVFSFNSPVWFNVGTPAKQQVSACQPYDSLVHTPSGLIPIGQIVEHDLVGLKVFDAHGLTTVVATKANGVKDVLRLHTKAGHTLDVTADHLVWQVTSATGGRFVEAGTLRAGDQLSWNRRVSEGSGEVDLAEISEAALVGARGTDTVMPERLLTAPLPVVTAYLRSLFDVEGFVSAEAGSTMVGLAATSEELVRGVQSLLLRYGIFARVARKMDKRTDRHDLWEVRIQSEGDRDLFEVHMSFDMPGRPEHDTKVLQIARVEPLGPMPVYDIQTESGEYLSGGLRVHNCFILAVEDTMESILNWYREEGLIFKGGSGSGINLSRIRSSKELLHSGGTASGPVSFMRGADASAGTIKSGGATRRAAKMVVLDVDHPDIAEFVETKAREEDKIRVLRDAGFDMDLGGRDIASVQYQNANNSVRVTDEFMRAVEAGESFGLRARTNGEVVETVDAQELWQSIAQAAWECADPGIQYDGTINDWHTTPESGRINASNPCFPADQRVVTDKGLIPIGDLVSRAATGETFAVYTNDVTSETDPAARVVATRPLQYMVTGTNPIVSLEFSDGSTLRCTPKHRLWTENRGWVRAEDLTETDEVVRSFHEASRPSADLALPEKALAAARAARGWAVTLPGKWSEDLGHYLGWLVGDGCLTDAGAVTVYGAGDVEEVLPRHREFLAEVMEFEAMPSLQGNGTVQLRALRARWRSLLSGLGVSSGRSAEKVVPEAVFEAPDEALRAFLQGLFDADGCVVDQKAKGTRYVGLGSRSKRLLQDVQELLASLGVAARIYTTGTKTESFTYTTVGGEERTYGSDGPSHDLRISGRSIAQFARRVGFTLSRKQERLDAILADHSFYAVRETVRLRSRVDDGHETTYNLTEPRNHSYVVNGVVVANCSEYMHLDNSSCNLASLNLLRFLQDDGSFDADRFAKSVELVITAMDISICFADFPTEAIGDTTRKFRQLGIGYANLGALLMASGLAYDSEGGRALAASITSLMTGTAYKRSAELAGVVGAYEGYARNVEPHKRVMRKHAEANGRIQSLHPMDIAVKELAGREWETCLSIGEAAGWRNAQASVLAPTGTIGFMMDCDTTGIEPDFSLVKFKKLVGGGSMQIVNQTIPRALRKFGYAEETIEAIVAYIAEHGHVVDAPGLRPEHYDVFDCAVGTRSISPMGHVRMMAAVQPFLSGAISKTVNMPEDATVEDVAEVYLEGWKMGLKALAIYRDNCKVGQPLSTGGSKKAEKPADTAAAAPVEAVATPEPEVRIEYRPIRKRLPKKRPANTTSFTVGGAQGYMISSSYPDDGLGELFLKMAKQGSTLAGVMDAFSIAVSIGLQYGVPLETYVEKFTNMRFEPAGLTDDPDVRMTSSIVDYVFRRLALDYLDFDTRSAMGIHSAEERQRQLETGSYLPAEGDDQSGGLGDDLHVPAPAQASAAPAVKESPAAGPDHEDHTGHAGHTPERLTVEAPGSIPAARPVSSEIHSSAELMDALQGRTADSPMCMTCGVKMRPAGSCYVCEGCGSTSGCS
jgi:ribonucleoside-diphosphate reductase alpha chain